MRANIFQIFYDDVTERQLDRGFLALENRGNLRPDWREYWVIRQFFQNNTLEEEALYGFFSPNFSSKTGLSAQHVHRFIDENPDHDAYTFSPFVQDAACYLNMFEQGNRYHPGMLELTGNFFDLIDLKLDFTRLVMDFRSTVYCNFIVAKPVFWKSWFAINERLFDEVERGTSVFAQRMRQATSYYKMPLDMKVFISERIAGTILALDQQLRVAYYDVGKMPLSDNLYYPCRDEMFTLNALKMAYLGSQEGRYLQLFFELRNQVLRRCDLKYGDEKRLTFFE